MEGMYSHYFFLLSNPKARPWELRVYDDLIREKWSVDYSIVGGSSQKCRKDGWPPQWIIQYYGPATWNPNEWVSRAREPIYNQNWIIRLQAVLEITTNQNASTLDLSADQSSHMRNVIFQHCMVLDYLLAEEEGVCGKLNDTHCCLQTDNNRKIVKEIKEMWKHRKGI